MKFEITYYSDILQQDILRFPPGIRARYFLMMTHAELKMKALADPETRAEYEAQKPEFELLDKLLEARKRAGLTQEQVAEKMGTKATAITRLESANSNHSPSVHTLQKFAKAVGCQLKIELIPHSTR